MQNLFRLMNYFNSTHFSVLSIIIGSWDIRRAVLAGKGDRLNRYFDRLLEQCLQMIIQMQNNGQTVTQFTLLYEMGNFNLVQQGCAACKGNKFAKFCNNFA